MVYLGVIVAAVLFLAVEFSGAATITSYTAMTGEGVIDRTVDVQTAKWYNGLKYSDEMHTPYTGWVGPGSVDVKRFDFGQLTWAVERYGASKVEFEEEICMTGTNDSEISIEGKYKTEQVVHRVDVRSYAVGTRYQIDNTGGENSKHKFLVNQNRSVMQVEAGVWGKGGWCVIAKDPEDKLKEWRDKSDYNGIYDLIIRYNIERVSEAEPLSDWLGCP